MSGGIEETYNLANFRHSVSPFSSKQSSSKLNAESFWNIIVAARRKKSVIGCNIELKE